jgi:hypothetical protein
LAKTGHFRVSRASIEFMDMLKASYADLCIVLNFTPLERIQKLILWLEKFPEFADFAQGDFAPLTWTKRKQGQKTA